jgi:cyclophilin family peptidyl-prolyl cis-trans isomerase
MEMDGTIEIELDPYLAPTNVTRLARLVDDGYLDGLTFHRWVPNFVIQGGSPGANEYQGDGPFTRDEVGLLSHWRGTVGISTRGHDTGDGQIFVNLMDNVRLDHAYTLVGTVVVGMDVVDRVVEGSVISRAEVLPPR